MRRRWRRWLGGGALGLLLAGVAGFVWAFPALAAVGCPTCYGLERAGPGLIVEQGMPDAARLHLRADAAFAVVEDWFGGAARRPVLLACTTEACDRRLGGRGARATTYSTPFLTVVRLSPRGFDPVILVHEASHVALHGRIGVIRLLSGAVPAWFDEGLAVIVSGDGRYLAPGGTAAERCIAEPAGELPASPWTWARDAGQRPALYAEAACSVLRWIEANGGRAGLLAALDAVAAGERRIP